MSRRLMYMYGCNVVSIYDDSIDTCDNSPSSERACVSSVDAEL